MRPRVVRCRRWCLCEGFDEAFAGAEVAAVVGAGGCESLCGGPGAAFACSCFADEGDEDVAVAEVFAAVDLVVGWQVGQELGEDVAEESVGAYSAAWAAVWMWSALVASQTSVAKMWTKSLFSWLPIAGLLLSRGWGVVIGRGVVGGRCLLRGSW